jgi:hypothetical protein
MAHIQCKHCALYCTAVNLVNTSQEFELGLPPTQILCLSKQQQQQKQTTPALSLTMHSSLAAPGLLTC